MSFFDSYDFTRKSPSAWPSFGMMNSESSRGEHIEADLNLENRRTFLIDDILRPEFGRKSPKVTGIKYSDDFEMTSFDEAPSGDDKLMTSDSAFDFSQKFVLQPYFYRFLPYFASLQKLRSQAVPFSVIGKREQHDETCGCVEPLDGGTCGRLVDERPKGFFGETEERRPSSLRKRNRETLKKRKYAKMIIGDNKPVSVSFPSEAEETFKLNEGELVEDCEEVSSSREQNIVYPTAADDSCASSEARIDSNVFHQTVQAEKDETKSLKKNNETKTFPLPAWIYCTRYSDRPSAGPRTRKLKSRNNQSKEDKRPRTAFTNEQLDQLNVEFSQSRYLNEERRQEIAGRLQLDVSQVKIWFQNKRANVKKSKGVPNILAIRLMADGLYNHSTVTKTTSDEENHEKP